MHIFNSPLDDIVNLISRTQMEQIDAIQNEALFVLRYNMESRSDNLRSIFLRIVKPKVYLSYSLVNLVVPFDEIETVHLDRDFFIIRDSEDLEQKKIILHGSVVVLLAGDAAATDISGYIALYIACDAIFIVWDWDNHHCANRIRISTSCIMAAHSDIYAPAHPQNIHALSSFNSKITGPMSAGTCQWSRSFLRDGIHDIIRAARTDAPLGKYRWYPTFSNRNRVIITLSNIFPESIGFSEYDNLAPEPRFSEWCGHKVHWIVPTCNDIPCRCYDALITGGVVILPESFRFSEPSGLLPGSAVYYGARDLIEPNRIVQDAIRMFDEGGQDGILRRHLDAFDRFHSDNILATLLEYSAILFGVTWR